MKLFYKVLLIVLVIFSAANLYAIDWSLGALAEDNQKFWVSFGAGILGIMLTIIMETLGRLHRRVG